MRVVRVVRVRDTQALLFGTRQIEIVDRNARGAQIPLRQRLEDVRDERRLACPLWRLETDEDRPSRRSPDLSGAKPDNRQIEVMNATIVATESAFERPGNAAPGRPVDGPKARELTKCRSRRGQGLCRSLVLGGHGSRILSQPIDSTILTDHIPETRQSFAKSTERA